MSYSKECHSVNRVIGAPNENIYDFNRFSSYVIDYSLQCGENINSLRMEYLFWGRP